jgi:hypothetical protein
MKQTAVEWLIIQMHTHWTNEDVTFQTLLEQAKEMEKEQIIDFTRKAVRKILDEDRQNPFNLEQYFNETFKKE